MRFRKRKQRVGKRKQESANMLLRDCLTPL
jgi:hypothetical protein